MTVKESLEIINLVAVPILAFGTIIAFFQYNKFKRDIEIKYQREITSQTIEVITHFSSKIAPLFRSLKSRNENSGNRFRYDGTVDLNDHNFIDSCNSYAKTLDETEILKHEEIINEINKICIGIELGIIDEETVYSTISSGMLIVMEGSIFRIGNYLPEPIANYKSYITFYNKWLMKNKVELERVKKKEQDANVEKLQAFDVKLSNAIGKKQ